jgi:hypothetical protein
MIVNPLVVEQVDGVPAASGSIIEIRGLKMKSGIRYTLEGYESGEFGGHPSWSAPTAQQLFTYRRAFIVTKALKEQPYQE